ncbi:hypothetical protein L1887_53398 [Cichorium endivia]|nr:hypothetical protein L1887_53398 [Cichorium endivia]
MAAEWQVSSCSTSLDLEARQQRAASAPKACGKRCGVEQNIRAGKLYHVLDCAIKGVKLGAQRMTVLYALSTKGAGSSLSLSWMAQRPTGPGCHCDGEGGREREREKGGKQRDASKGRGADEASRSVAERGGAWRYATDAGAQQPGSCAPKWVGPVHCTTVQSALEFESLCIANRPHSLPDAKPPEYVTGAHRAAKPPLKHSPVFSPATSTFTRTSRRSNRASTLWTTTKSQASRLCAPTAVLSDFLCLSRWADRRPIEDCNFCRALDQRQPWCYAPLPASFRPLGSRQHQNVQSSSAAHKCLLQRALSGSQLTSHKCRVLFAVQASSRLRLPVDVDARGAPMQMLQEYRRQLWNHAHHDPASLVEVITGVCTVINVPQAGACRLPRALDSIQHDIALLLASVDHHESGALQDLVNAHQRILCGDYADWIMSQLCSTFATLIQGEPHFEAPQMPDDWLRSQQDDQDDGHDHDEDQPLPHVLLTQQDWMQANEPVADVPPGPIHVEQEAGYQLDRLANRRQLVTDPSWDDRVQPCAAGDQPRSIDMARVLGMQFDEPATVAQPPYDDKYDDASVPIQDDRLIASGLHAPSPTCVASHHSGSASSKEPTAWGGLFRGCVAGMLACLCAAVAFGLGRMYAPDAAALSCPVAVMPSPHHLVQLALDRWFRSLFEPPSLRGVKRYAVRLSATEDENVLALIRWRRVCIQVCDCAASFWWDFRADMCVVHVCTLRSRARDLPALAAPMPSLKVIRSILRAQGRRPTAGASTCAEASQGSARVWCKLRSRRPRLVARSVDRRIGRPAAQRSAVPPPMPACKAR